MKTGYDQHFKKIKQSSKPKALDLKKIKMAAAASGKKDKKSFPLAPLMGFMIIAGSGLVFLSQFETIESYLQKIEIGIGVANAEEAKTPAATTADAATPAVDGKTGSVEKTNLVEAKKLDDTDYLFKLADRKKQLDKREEELNKQAAQLEKQKAELAEKLTQLEDVRQKISAALQDRIKADDGKVDVLVQIYTNMKPGQAAKVFESLDEDLVIEILSRMKKKSAADILNLIKPEKAQLFAERYTGYRTPASAK